MTSIEAFAPGRINLIGDHTDTTGGWCLPMAIDLGTRVRGNVAGDRVVLVSDAEVGVADVPLDIEDPSTIEPHWARYVAGVVAELRPDVGFSGMITSTVPAGSGLSSSAALEVSVALALGFDGGAVELARVCQRAEHRASGVPCGVMDQLSSAAGVEGHALLIDCTSLDVAPVRLPADVDVVAVHSGTTRRLAGSAYALRRADLEAAEGVVGPLRSATLSDLDAIKDEQIRRRARHVVSENQRTLDAAAALSSGDLAAMGEMMVESHRSLRDEYQVSTPELDALVERLMATPGVFGARLTGAGFGGCAVALCDPGTVPPQEGVWILRASVGASRT